MIVFNNNLFSKIYLWLQFVIIKSFLQKYIKKSNKKYI